MHRGGGGGFGGGGGGVVSDTDSGGDSERSGDHDGGGGRWSQLLCGSVDVRVQCPGDDIDTGHGCVDRNPWVVFLL